MSETATRIPLLGLCGAAADLQRDELNHRLAEEGFPDIRPGHGCVFRFVDSDGSRLTELAERSGLTKQAVGEAVQDLEGRGYVERVPDPVDGRAKIIRLTERGREALAAAERIFADIERTWAERFGEERLALVRETLEMLVAADDVPVSA